MTPDSPWLTDEQQRVWRRWLAVNDQLPAALHRELQADSDLSLQDFDVLVQLTDAVEGRVRVSELATALRWERSRLSHHVKRMEGRGLVRREECADDGRGAFVVLTAAGRAAIERAAPGARAHGAPARLRRADPTRSSRRSAAITGKVLTQLERDAAPDPAAH